MANQGHWLPSSLEERLDRIEALDQIRQLASRYALAVDTRNMDDLAALLPNVRYVDPPWPDTEWIDGEPRTLFRSWPKLAPILHQWANEAVG